jgi:hypothetical protein
MGRTTKAKEKFDIKKGIEEIEEAAAEVDPDDENEGAPDGGAVLSALDTFSKALRGFFGKSESVSDETDELAGSEDEHAAFGRPRDSKGAKGKMKVDTHEGMEPTGQEDEDRESDEADGASETANSAEPTGDRDAPNPTKRRRKVDLPQELRTGYKSRARRAEAQDDEEIDEVEKGIATDALEELAGDSNFAEVVEASEALQVLTDVVIKGLARMEARQIRFEQRMTKSLGNLLPVLKSLAGIDPDEEGAEGEEDEVAARPIKKSGRGATHEANPGILAIVDGKEMRVALPEGYQGRVSKSKSTLSAAQIEDLKERLTVEMEKGNIDPEVLRSFDAHGIGALASLDADMRKSLGVEILN